MNLPAQPGEPSPVAANVPGGLPVGLPAGPLHPAALLRMHTQGTLLYAEVTRVIRFVIDGRDGAIVFPVESAALAEGSLVLFVPDERHEKLQLLLDACEIVDWRNEGICDRWQAYHGRADRSTWCRAIVDAAKLMGKVIEEQHLCSPNPLVADEPRLCRELNSDRAAVAAAVGTLIGRPTPEALVVGVDSWGLDVRTGFDVARLPFARPAMTGAEAGRAAADLLALHRKEEPGS